MEWQVGYIVLMLESRVFSLEYPRNYKTSNLEMESLE